MSELSEAAVKGVVDRVLDGIDEDAVDYFVGMIIETGVDASSLQTTLGPFVESYAGVSEEESLRTRGIIDQ